MNREDKREKVEEHKRKIIENINKIENYQVLRYISIIIEDIIEEEKR